MSDGEQKHPCFTDEATEEKTEDSFMQSGDEAVENTGLGDGPGNACAILPREEDLHDCTGGQRRQIRDFVVTGVTFAG